jgi:hypothetical protein
MKGLDGGSEVEATDGILFPYIICPAKWDGQTNPIFCIIHYSDMSTSSFKSDATSKPKAPKPNVAARRTVQTATLDAPDPMEWNKCPCCLRRGHAKQMFTCDGCEESFHPKCVTKRLPTNSNDKRYAEFLCPGCFAQKDDIMIYLD